MEKETIEGHLSIETNKLNVMVLHEANVKIGYEMIMELVIMRKIVTKCIFIDIHLNDKGRMQTLTKEFYYI